jgi:hypothetical protein
VLKAKPKDSHAWVITALPEQRYGVLKHKVAVNKELLYPTTNTSEKLTEAKLTKKNCLMFIAVNLNMNKSTEEVE